MSYESSKQSVLSNSAPSDYSISVLIDHICDEFEKSWKSDRPVTIEQQLSKVSPGNQSALFRELLEIEVELRSARKEKFQIDEYLQRFPLEAELIDLVFRKAVRRRKLGDYELLDEIGHGGMGIVYRGRQVFLGQTVAVKVLSQPHHSDAQVVSRFRREMRMIGGLHHPNIVQALNAGESGGTLYLAMEYVDGYNLHSLVKKTVIGASAPRSLADETSANPDAGETPALPGFPIGAAAEVIRQAAFGLEHAFEQGLVHRDIKPANLMITKNGVVKILDLGLGKFRAENQLNESLQPALTQFGATMGTIDYMAPEQWENATDVDIRADIYGLGCTLFFMLTGIAPLDTQGSISDRQKLLARLEGYVPNIEEHRPDCPPELVEILRKMIAGEPADRYQTPNELFQAITPFADPDALKSVIAAAPVTFESGRESTPAYRTGYEDTLHGNEEWSADRTQRSRGISPSSMEYLGKKPFQAVSHSFWYGYQPGLMLLICALIGFFVFRGSNNDPVNNDPVNDEPIHHELLSMDTIDVQSPTEPNGSGVVSPSKPESDLINPIVEEILCDLVELPGLNGQWWFDEMPWYLPCVRKAIPDALRQGSNEWMFANSLPYLDPNAACAQEFLWGLTESVSENLPAHKKTLVEGLYQAFDKRLDKEEMVHLLRRLLADYETAILLIPETEHTASDDHTVALMRHRIAQQTSDQTLAGKAKESYQAAIQKYTRQTEEKNGVTTSQVARQLRMVCLSDFARLSFWADNDFAAFEKSAETIRSLKDVRQSDLFMIEFLTTYGDYCTAAGKNNDSLFEKANEILDGSKITAATHPLQAHISERLAWSLIDQCKFKEAEGEFSRALRFRLNNLERSRNPFAAIYVYHNQHGLAICKRYLGDTEEAKSQFEEVVKRVDAALHQTDFREPAQQRYFSSLNERLGNTLERYGDCTLYGGAASFETPYSRVSASDMKSAAQLYERSRNAAVNKAVWYVMSCKAAIVKAMSGAPDEAKTILDELEKHTTIAFGSDQRRATMMRKIADLVYQLKWSERENQPEKIDESLASLRRYLSQFHSETANESRYRREPLELQLFCAEVLITSMLKTGNFGAAREEVPGLETLLSPFTSLESTRPFFYRYYDLAIQCFAESEQDKTDPVAKERAILNQLKFIRHSRLWRMKKSSDPAATDTAVGDERETFFFYFSPQGGIAIFAPADEAKPMERFTIPYTRQAVKDAAGSGKKLTLPVELAGRINAERADNRAPVISFDDRPCWYRKSDALQDADWPFDVPIR